MRVPIGLLAVIGGTSHLSPRHWPSDVRAFNSDRFEEFFQLLPKNMAAALKLARRGDQRMIGSSYLRLRHRRVR